MMDSYIPGVLVAHEEHVPDKFSVRPAQHKLKPATKDSQYQILEWKLQFIVENCALWQAILVETLYKVNVAIQVSACWLVYSYLRYLLQLLIM